MFKFIIFKSRTNFSKGNFLRSMSQQFSLCGSAEVSLPPPLYAERVQWYKEMSKGNIKKRLLWKKCRGSHSAGRFSRVWGQHHNRVLRVRLSGEGYDKLIGMDDKGGTHWVFKGVFLTSQHVSLNGVALLGFNLEHKICYLILIGICRLCLDVNPASLAWLNCDNVVVHISVGEPALAQETVRRRNMKRKLAKTANFPPAGETLSVSPRSFVSVCMKAGDFFVLIVV